MKKTILILNLVVNVRENTKKCSLDFTVKPEALEHLVDRVLSEKRFEV